MTVTRQISLAACAVVAVVVVVTIIAVVLQSRPHEIAEKAAQSGDKVYVDIGAVLGTLLVMGVGAIVFAAVASWYVARRAVRPLGRALRLQREFVADASHELRTPLAVLDARLQLLQRSLGADDPHAEAVVELRRDTGALIELVSELLLAAGGDEEVGSAGSPDATVVVEAAVEDLSILGRGVGVELFARADGEVLPVTLSATSLRRCVIALVDNAIAHSVPGSRVDVVLRRVGRRVVLTVADRGSGIRGISPDRIFDRFARAEPDAAAGTPRTRRGFGIGLALVRDLVVRSGGDVRVETTSAAGTTIALELPLA